MIFKKVCFRCGKKVDETFSSMCEECFKEENPPIVEIKPINMKFCNSCKKINYQNYFYTQEEIENNLANIVKKNLVLNKEYSLKKVNIQNFEIKGNRVCFDVEVETNLIK